MPTDITINDISGTTPFDIYVCDNPITSCIYISTITTGDTPYTFSVPLVMEGMTDFNLKVVDDNNCIVYQNLILP